MSNLTLQQLVNQKISSQELSPRQLVSALGYTNVSKGCRRLKEYLTTLRPPSDFFVINLLTILDINGLEYSEAVLCTQAKIDSSARSLFKPYIELLAKIEITPLFARAMLYQKYCIQTIPTHIQTKPFIEEIEFIISAYRGHYSRFLSNMNPNLARKHVDQGFRYWRQHDHYFEFDNDAMLVSINDVKPVLSTKHPLGNRVFNVIAGGMG